MKPLSPAQYPKNSAHFLLAQLEISIVNLGQALKQSDVSGLERHAHDVMGSLTTIRAALSTSDPIMSDQSAKVALKKYLEKMNLQLQQQKELLMRKSSMTNLQLDALLPPIPRLTYITERQTSNERFGSKTFLKA